MNTIDSGLEIRSKEYALKCHTTTNHLYAGMPYKTHLEEVVNTCWMFIHGPYCSLIPREDIPIIICAAWCHDVIEDTRQTFSDVYNHTNWKIAEIVYALTNEKGKNREQRANKIYYRGIRRTKYAIFIKLCDRIANVKYSKENKSRMFDLYKKENYKFLKSLRKSLLERISYPEPNYKFLISYLDSLFV